MSKLNRRAAMIGAAAVAAGAAVPAIAAAPTSPITPARIRTLADACRAANLAECDVNDAIGVLNPEFVPAYQAARARTQALLDEFSALAEAVWASPIRNWQDVLARAEVARHWEIEEPDFHCPANCADSAQRALYELLNAVLIAGGSHA